MSTFVAGFIIGFAKEWRLTLLILALTPFLAICGLIFTLVSINLAISCNNLGSMEFGAYAKVTGRW